MATEIHPTAIVDPGANLGANVSIGPYAVIEHDVTIGDNTSIGSHVIIGEHTILGKENRIFHGAAVGLIPQDLKFAGEKTYLRVGDRNIIREFCTLNRGTAARGETVIGNDCALLAYSHVAHDCVIGDRLVASNNLGMGGHVTVGNHVTLGGFCGIHQFSRIGDHAMVQVSSFINQDILPFALTAAEPLRVIDVNTIGLERRGFSAGRIRNIKQAYRILFRENLRLDEALVKLKESYPGDADVASIVSFIKGSERGILRIKE
jgi:UDP-N-acetylglucosamine acyltransferase